MPHCDYNVCCCPYTLFYCMICHSTQASCDQLLACCYDVDREQFQVHVYMYLVQYASINSNIGSHTTLSLWRCIIASTKLWTTKDQMTIHDWQVWEPLPFIYEHLIMQVHGCILAFSGVGPPPPLKINKSELLHLLIHWELSTTLLLDQHPSPPLCVLEIEKRSNKWQGYHTLRQLTRPPVSPWKN